MSLAHTHAIAALRYIDMPVSFSNNMSHPSSSIIVDHHHDHHHHHGHDHHHEDKTVDDAQIECRLIGGTFAIVIQLLLGVVVLSALFMKRYWKICECKFKEPERDFRIWALDVGKQAIGSCFAHACNLVLAILLSTIVLQNPGDEAPMHPDECAWYFINFLADSVLGIPLSWALLELVHVVALRCNLEGLQETGNYGTENVYCTWLIQLIAWLWIVFATKLTMGLMIWPLGQVLGRFGVWLFGPMHKAPQLELVFVMVIAPSIINVFVFWIYDNMLMAPSDSGMGTSSRKKIKNNKKLDDPEDGGVVKRKTIDTPGADVVDTTTMKRRIFVRGDRSINFPKTYSSTNSTDEETVLLLDDDGDMPE